jgi:hypothetical protein
MPLSPLPPSNTARLWVDYATENAQHSMMFRYSPSAGISAAQAAIDLFLSALAPTIYQITILGVRAAASGSDITNPVGSDLSATYGEGTEVLVVTPRELRFVGRSTDGRKNSISVYGFEGSTPDTFRFQPEDNANLDAAVAQLVASSTVIGLTISGAQAIWKPYVNIQFNSHWETELRG